MAIDQQKLQIILEAKGVKLTKSELKSLQGTVNGTGAALGSMAKNAAGAAAVFFAAKGLIEGVARVTQLSGKVEQMTRGFDNLAKSAGFSQDAFKKLQTATDGTVGSMELMQQANNAMLLGVVESEDQMAEMFDIAQRLGQALGRDTASSVESLVTGLGRQSKLMLDNLGIMVDVGSANEEYAKSINKTVSELTDQEKKTAFINATMKEAKKLTDSLGEEQLGTSEAFAQMTVAIENAAIAIGDTLAPVVVNIANLITLFADSVTDIMNWRDAYLELAKDAKLLSPEDFALLELKKQAEEMTKPEIVAKMQDLGVTINAVGEDFIDMGGSISMASDEDVHNAAMVQVLLEAYENAGDGVDTFREKFEEFRAEKEKELEIYENEQKFIQMLIDNYPKMAQKLNLVTDATKKQTKAKDAQDKAEKRLMNTTAQAMGQFVGGAKIAARIQQVSATVDAYRTINKIMADPKLVFPTNVLTAASVGVQAFANVMAISQSIGEFKTAATGMDEIVDKPTLILAGEAGAEHVGITPLEQPGVDAPSGGGGITVNLSGNVMTQDFVEGELAEAISEAIRKGNDFGIS